MRVLVCGGRDFSDQKLLEDTLNTFHQLHYIDCIIEGNGRGADRMAGFWARKNHIDNIKFSANWKEYGNAAGPIRNAEMLFKGNPDIVIAFPGGKGTANMVQLAKKNNVEVIEICSHIL